MFIRVKTAPGSPRKTVQLVESVRSGKKAGQRIVRHIGVARSEAELDKLMELGEVVKAEVQCERRPSLFPPEDLAELAIKARRPGGKKGPLVEIEKTREERRIAAGIHEAYGTVYRQLGFDGLLPSGRNGSARRVLHHMAMARIANPDSKRGTARRLEAELGVSIPVQRIYRMMDRLDVGTIESMKSLAAGAARRLLPEPASVVFFDCTTLHFESVEEDGLREFGFSKNGRHGQVQVLLALMVSSDGLPLGYEVFPGSKHEGKSLIPSLERMREREGIKRAIHVADRGMFGETNLKGMEDRGLQCIVGARLKALPKALKERILDLESYKPTGGSRESRSAEFECKGRRIVVGWSRARAAKDAADRRKAVEKLVKKLRRSANPAQALSGRGFGRFVKVEGAARLEIDEEKIREAARWDGIKGIVTNIDAPGMGHAELFSRYRELWRVEESFRITKHDLKVRPVFHWKPERVKAHIAIAYMAFACVRHLACRIELQQRERMSPERIRQALAARQCSIIRDAKSGRRFALPSRTTPDMERICRTLGLPRSRTPYWID